MIHGQQRYAYTLLHLKFICLRIKDQNHQEITSFFIPNTYFQKIWKRLSKQKQEAQEYSWSLSTLGQEDVPQAIAEMACSTEKEEGDEHQQK